MRCLILGFVVGVAGLQIRAELPSGTLVVCLVAAGILLLLLRRAALSALGGAFLGFCWAAWLGQLALAPTLSAADEGRDLMVIGVIDSLPYNFDQGVRFQFRVEQATGARAAVPPRIALAWYTGFRDSEQQAGNVQPGERWQLTVRLQRPHGNANPHGFDYEAWLLEQGVRATGYVRPAGAGNRRIGAFVPGFSTVVERTRAALRTRIRSALAGKEYAGVIVALVIGDQRAIAQSDWKVFNRTGVSHLVSISGLHITMVAGLFASMASALWRRSLFTRAQLPLILPAQKVAALAGAGVGLLYVLLAGFGIPAQRTLYMLAVVAAALWFGRITNVSHVLCSALGIVVLLDPWSVLAPGFWLSFGAVGVILYATVGRIKPREGRVKAALRLGAHTQYVVTIGLVPLTMLLFSQVSIVSPVANAVAIPVVSFVVTPLSLAGSLAPAPISNILLGAAHFAMEALALFLGWLGDLRFAVWTAPAPDAWMLCFAVIGTVWMLAPRGWPVRWTGMAGWLPLLANLPTHPAEGDMHLTAFDVGQGMALLVETRSHRLLYDTGPYYSPESNGGNRIIAPYLRARGIGRLDGIVVSHSDVDHAGGALAVLDAVRAGWVLSSLWEDHAIVKAAPVHRRCVAGQGWEWDGVKFEMLHPSPASYADKTLKSNARGCTLRITARGHSVLLAGDIEAAQEAELLNGGMRARLPATVLLAPHHGSGTSSTMAFLEAVRPSVALFQVGYRNRYRHPKREVIERYKGMGIERLRTDETGAITLKFGQALTVEAYRRAHARYWYPGRGE
ncbi:DNA internalization-related competence protein ComEC/Rec2 [Massilia cavernae]|uniref:DNA internalization-related competence protein ComEC/Rec2 n=1 Tax=Massilia cavernae TaxID=2320864 RepID=A0A418Y4W1_9BURK|nr:DNA internalization-related competence protein ComEC/Rec2 [Massilia cavernae]RJG21087.1 DNA internalization-related competence protein ComEC/Rec2 [Massilia cavernae]